MFFVDLDQAAPVVTKLLQFFRENKTVSQKRIVQHRNSWNSAPPADFTAGGAGSCIV